MKISPINPSNTYGWQKPHKKEEDTEETTPDQPTGSTETAVAPAEPTDSQDQRGVIRLLQEGHFKGVADLRLRINFHDELSAIQAEATQAVNAEKSGQAVTAVETAVTEFTTENQITEQQAQDLAAAYQAFQQTAAQPDPEILTNAFQTFIETLQALSPPSEEPSEPLDPQPAEEPPLLPPSQDNGTGPDWQAFIETLQTVFSAAIQDFTNALNSTNTLPPLSEPNGNGHAYDKFLAIYNELYGIQPDVEQVDTTEPPP